MAAAEAGTQGTHPGSRNDFHAPGGANWPLTPEERGGNLRTEVCQVQEPCSGSPSQTPGGPTQETARRPCNCVSLGLSLFPSLLPQYRFSKNYHTFSCLKPVPPLPYPEPQSMHFGELRHWASQLPSQEAPTMPRKIEGTQYPKLEVRVSPRPLW